MLRNVQKCAAYKRRTKALGNMMLYLHEVCHIATFFIMIA